MNKHAITSQRVVKAEVRFVKLPLQLPSVNHTVINTPSAALDYNAVHLQTKVLSVFLVVPP